MEFPHPSAVPLVCHLRGRLNHASISRPLRNLENILIILTLCKLHFIEHTKSTGGRKTQ